VQIGGRSGGALAELGAPVVVKGCSPEVVHKSELGLVRLGLDNEQAVRAAFREMERTLRGQGRLSMVQSWRRWPAADGR